MSDSKRWKQVKKRSVRTKVDLAAEQNNKPGDIAKGKLMFRARNEAVLKEEELRSCSGPSSIPDPWYPKSIFIKKQVDE